MIGYWNYKIHQQHT